MKPKIIAIAGQMRNGKNEIGEYICRKNNFVPASFATPVKKIFCEFFNVDLEFLEKWKTEINPPDGFGKNIRQSLQFIGDGFRQIKSNIWVEYAEKNNPEYSCYMDCRYINELYFIRKKSGINILVWRPFFENNDPNGSESQIKLIVDWFVSKKVEGSVCDLNFKDSPEGSQYIDYFIINDSTVDSLYKKIDDLILPNIN
jgi:hypothetical protein